MDDHSLIEHCIAEAEKLGRYHREGNNSKVILFGDVVLIKTKVSEEELLRAQQKIKDAKADGIDTPAILDYKIIGEPDSKGKCECYILQERALGKEFLDIGMTAVDESDIPREMADFANAPQEQYDKFISDWVTLEEKYSARMDPRRTNYFIDTENKKFRSIDLVFEDNLATRTNPIKMMAPYAYDWPKNEVEQEMTAIITLKTVTALQKAKGLSNEEIAKGLFYLATDVNTGERIAECKEADKNLFTYLKTNPSICKEFPNIDFAEIFRLREPLHALLSDFKYSPASNKGPQAPSLPNPNRINSTVID